VRWLIVNAAASVGSTPGMVELVGPAGAGKTTLLRALQQRLRSLQPGPCLSPRRHLAYAPSLLSTFGALHRPYRGVLWKEMKRILFLHTLQQGLQAPAPAENAVIALDEGAVYMLARLRVLGADRVESPTFERWWQGAIKRWSHLLDIVILLDADDSVLARRLRTRPQAHPARGFSDEAIGRFMATYRGAYDDVVAELASAGHTDVMRFRTDHEASTSMAEQVVSEISRRCI
jgi:energy-coupling factor transporter ATP-binding protein EcfA2